MKMGKKFNVALVILLAISMLFTGCISGNVKKTSDTPAASNAEKTSNPPAANNNSSKDPNAFITAKSDNPKKIVLRFASTSRNIDDHPYMRGFREFLRILKTELGDKVEIQYFLGGTLGTTTDAILGGLQNKSFQITDWPLGSFAELTKAFQPFDVPYLITSPEGAMKLLNGKVGQIMREKCIKDTNIRPVYYGIIGMRQMTNSKKEIKKPDDLKGLKIRVQNNPLHIEGMKAFGASPTPIAFAELFTSLQQKVVDGQENPIATIYDSKYYEVQSYMTLTNHLFTAGTLAINEDYYQSLPADVKAAFDKAGKAASEYTLNEVKAAEDELLKKLSDKIKIYKPTPEELKAFQDQAKTAWPKMEEKIGKEYFDQILKEAGLK